jgi:hypothetical protein
MYLETRDPAAMSMDDWSLLLEYLINRYLPPGVIEREADFLAVRAVLMGKIQANLETDHRLTDPMLETLTALLPTRFAHVPSRVLSDIEIAILNYGRAHAAENIRSITESARHRMAMIVLEHTQAGILGQRGGGWQAMQTRLFDLYGALNRDMRRIAVTESGELTNQGYIVASGTGKRVKRVEAYRGACDFCASINGKIFTIVPADAPNKDGATQIWPGKTNVGRSASPMKRVGDRLVEREPHELWWPASGVQHPNCRGAWMPVTDRPPAVSKEFFDFTQDLLDKATART